MCICICIYIYIYIHYNHWVTIIEWQSQSGNHRVAITEWQSLYICENETSSGLAAACTLSHQRTCVCARVLVFVCVCVYVRVGGWVWVCLWEWDIQWARSCMPYRPKTNSRLIRTSPLASQSTSPTIRTRQLAKNSQRTRLNSQIHNSHIHGVKSKLVSNSDKSPCLSSRANNAHTSAYTNHSLTMLMNHLIPKNGV